MKPTKQVNIYNEAPVADKLLPVANDIGSFLSIMTLVFFVVIPELFAYL